MLFLKRHKFLFLLLFITNISWSQSIKKKLTQADGLSSYNIRSILKDPNGILWICTQDGLSRYNGVIFKNYSKDNQYLKERIDFTDCRSLYIDSLKKQLWVLGSTGALDVINYVTGNIEERYYRPLASGDDWTVVFEKIDNELWIGSSQGLWVFSLVTKKFIAINLRGKLKKEVFNKINTIKKDKYGNVWVFVNETGAFVINQKAKKVVHAMSGEYFGLATTGSEFTSSAIISDTLWVGTNRGLRCYNYNNEYMLQPLKLPSVLASTLDNNPINSITTYKNNSLLICSKQLVQIATDFSSYSILNKATDKPDNWLAEIFAICPLDDKLLALGCNSGLAIYDLSAKPVSAIINDDQYFKNRLKHVYSLNFTHGNHFVIGTEYGLFDVTSIGVAKVIDTTDFYQNISEIQHQELIVSGRNGLKIYINQVFCTIDRIYPEFAPYKDWAVNSCKPYGKESYVLGTENEKGILLWDRAKHTIKHIDTKSMPIALRSDNVNTVYVDNASKIWVLSDFDVSVLEISKNYVRHVQLPPVQKNMPLGLFFDMVAVNNQFWMAAYGNGIIVLDEKMAVIKRINQSDGLCNNCVYKIFKAGNFVFVSSNNGFSRIDVTNYVCKSFFFPYDGLHGNSFEEACGYQIGDKIYFGGLDGVTQIDPSRITVNKKAPQLYFQEIQIETSGTPIDTFNLFLQDLFIPHDYRQARVSFVGINYHSSEKVNYWYRIKERSIEWSDLKTENFVQLIGTPPGTYTLEVKAANEDGVECAPISMTLHFKPKWYQTWEFKLAVALAIAGLLYALYSFRIKQLKRIISVRQKISNDLHDDIGSTLSTINMYSQVAQLHGPGHVPIMHNIQENAQEVLEKLDDIVWATNPKNDQVKNLVERIDAFARPLLQAKRIAFIFNAEEHISSHKIGEATRQNLFLICKEAINNVAKYAECKTCTVSLYKKRNHIHCTITDDGKGFDASLPTERNGLLNMRLRATAVKGELEISSSPGNGTSIKVMVPF